MIVNPLPPLQKLVDTVSDAIGQPNLGPELEQKLKQALQSALAKMDIVTREEFDAQTKVLQHSRAMLEKLEQEVEILTETLKDSDLPK